MRAAGLDVSVDEKEPQYCPKCGVAYEPLQEYCLECGERLPTNRGLVGVLAAAWQRRLPWYPGDWVWPALLFLAVALVATAGAVAAGSRSGPGTTIVARPTVTLGPGRRQTAPATTAPSTLPSAPHPTVTTGTLPKAPGAPSTKTATAPAPVSGALAAWPAATTGYTDVLESLPLSAGRAAAESRARTAKLAGLPQAGVLVSSSYASLHPGYYVVFSGVYRTPAEAVGALAAAHSRGFPDAYVARVTH
jgi:hypothetical protein